MIIIMQPYNCGKIPTMSKSIKIEKSLCPTTQRKLCLVFWYISSILIQWWQEVLRGIGIFEVCVLELPVDSLLGRYHTPNYPILKEALKGQGKSEDTAILKFASFSIVGALQNH